MITRSAAGRERPAWRGELARAVRDPAELLRLLDLDPGLLDGARAGAADFPLRVPRPYLARMRAGDPHDPLLRQVLPLEAETDETAGYAPDPLAERQALAAPGLLHKYQGRALLTVTGACAVNCRYCFRRHFPYGEAGAAPAHWDAALAELSARTDIREVILSGGDPLALDDMRLARLVHSLGAIAHVERLRVHTRLPVVLPERVDTALIAWLAATRLRPVVVVHANHPNEIDAETGAALTALAEAGATVLNQAVLLRGVNDDVEALAGLSERLFEHRVLPYYLHLADRVQGAAHFEVPDAEGVRLVEALRARLPGYLVPRLAREIPGEPGKRVLAG